MTRKFIGFSADNDYLKKVELLKKHLQTENITTLTNSDILKYAIDTLIKDHELII